jgi:hypothetical protein
MPIPLLAALVLGGGMLGSGLAQSSASKKASKIQKESAQQGITSQEAMFNKSLDINQPYREAGYNAIGGLQGLIDPAQRSQTLSDYYAGDEYQQMAGQVEEQQLRNAGATGGLRGGQNQAALASIAPQLGQQYMQGLQNQYTGLANMGMGAASQGAQGAQQFGAQQSALQQQAGQAAAQNAVTQGGIWGNTMQGLGGLAFGAAGGFA